MSKQEKLIKLEEFLKEIPHDWKQIKKELENFIKKEKENAKL